MDNTYQYQKLTGHGALRLLSLQPSPEINDRVECTMIHTTLSDMNDDIIDSYTALSYVWGDSRELVEIHVDGQSLHVTINLASALRHMRDHSRRRLIWADAICINQQDNSEKGEQVSQMGEVYRMARRTVIYLGDSTELSEMFFVALEKRKVGDKHPSENLSNDYLRDILFRPWFTRVWVYQELILSIDPWVQCGKSRVRWTTLGREISAIKDSDPELARIFLDMEKARKDAVVRATKPPLSTYEYLEILLDTLHKRRGLGVTDGRDMVYAHLGVAEVQKAVVPVDYTKTTSEVYEDFALCCIKATNSYDILGYAERRDGPTGGTLPSWCPDWGTIHDRKSLRGQARYFAFQTTPYMGEHFYLKRSETTSVLAGAGHRIGQLDRLSIEVAPVYVSKEQNFVNSGPSPILERPQYDAERGLEKILDVELMDLLRLPRQKYHKANEQYVLLINVMFFPPIISGQSGNSSLSLKRTLAIVMDEQRQQKFPALVPSATRIGDVVWWLSGSALPVVLRPWTLTEVPSPLNIELHDGLGRLGLEAKTEISHFQFVGECKLQGFLSTTPREWRIFALH